MTFRFDEIQTSRPFVDGQSAAATRIYRATGTTDEQYVAAFARAYVPNMVSTVAGILYLSGLRTDPDGHARWNVTAGYSPRKKQTGSYTWNFDTTGANVRITSAREHVASFPAEEGNADPHKGTIGVTKDGEVEGTDIIIPALKLQVQFRHPMGVVSLPFAKKLARLTGTTNLAPWLGGNFAAGELLFLGAQGSDGSEAEAEITYNFAASENVNDLSFGDINNIVKAGHHYAWVEYKDAVSGGKAATQPARVHVEKVYGEANFAAEFGWGS